MRQVAIILSLVLGIVAVPARAERRYGEREVAQLLAIAQAEKEPEPRRARAVRELEHTEERGHLPVLRRLLREERSLDIRLASACVLAALGDRSSPKDLLLATAYDGERTPTCSRADVLLALGRLGDPAGELHLERALQSPAPAEEPELHVEACRALALLRTPGARRLLVRTFRDGSPDLRRAAAPALGQAARSAGDAERREIRDLLLRAARTDADEGAAELAIRELYWGGLDPGAAFRILETEPEAAARARVARVFRRHYLPPAHCRRLAAALGREREETVRAAIAETLKDQPGPR